MLGIESFPLVRLILAMSSGFEQSLTSHCGPPPKGPNNHVVLMYNIISPIKA